MDDDDKGEHSISVCVDEETYSDLMSGNRVIQQVSTSPTDSQDEGTFRWRRSLISSLIAKRIQRESEFNRPLCKKKQLWKAIAREIGSEFDITSLTGEACDNKFRNLLATYRVNKKKQSSYGKPSITWEYYDIFDKAFGSKTVDDSPLWTMAERRGVVKPKFTPSPITPTQSKCTAMAKRRKNSISLEEYLFQKNARDSEMTEKKLKLQEQIWEEKKDLKEREIEAILDLAKTIKRSHSNDDSSLEY